ncbi:hypothetical protein R8Z50_30680 [Longispora sp. K20-0274]|uniref:hypothetical protein n=1 Tax=Longispora sp. K20-0274 TaxID=3088255 RepID=UPI00399A0F6F
MSMGWKIAFFGGLAVGYVMGAKAGRQRYEQIARLGRKVRQSPTLQEAAGVVQEQAGKLAHTGRQRVVRALHRAEA